MGGTKGSHLVVDNQALYDALGDRMVYYEHADGRICITFRFMGKVIVGSTDMRVDDPDEAACDDNELDYMMTTLKGVFPDIDLSNDDIVFTFCGVRPLPSSGLDYTSRVPRSHRLDIAEPDEQRDFRIYSMIGGKLTTFRAFAEQACDKILEQLGMSRKASTEDLCYRGASGFPADESERRAWIQRVAKANDLEEKRVADLLERYGSEAERFAQMTEASWRTPLQSLPEYTAGEIEYIAKNECVRHLSDLVRRRSVITMLGQATETVLTELAAIVGAVLGWDDRQRDEEIKLARREATDRK
jgi:glycerol-3-phosphate dehydrogenase